MALTRLLVPSLVSFVLAGSVALGLESFQSRSACAHDGHQHGGVPVEIKKRTDKPQGSKSAGKAKKPHTAARHKSHNH